MKRKIIIFIIFFSLILCSFSNNIVISEDNISESSQSQKKTGSRETSNSPWPMFGYDRNNTGLSQYPAHENDGSILWTYDLGNGYPFSTSIGTDGTIYFGSDQKKLYALNPNGTLKWKFNTRGDIYDTPTMGPNETIYFASFDDGLYAIHSNGTLKWRFEIMSWIFPSPTIGYDGNIYIGSDDHHLYSIFPNGTLRWKFKADGLVETTPAIGLDDTVYFSTTSGRLFALYSNGTEMWNQSGHGGGGSPAIDSNGNIISPSGQELWSFKPNGDENWRFHTRGTAGVTPAILKNDSIIYSSAGDLFSISKDGTLNWKLYFEQSIVGIQPLLSSDEIIFVGTADNLDNNHLYAIHSNGTIKWKTYTGGTILNPFSMNSDGTIYLSSGHIIYAINKEKKPDPVIPSTPMNLKLVSGDGYVDISWTPPEFDGGSEITNYSVYRKKGFDDIILILIASSSFTSYNDTSVTNGVKYQYYVTASNDVGESAPSNDLQDLPTAIPQYVDKKPPNITFVVPTDGYTYHKANAVLQGQVRDNIDLDQIEMKFNNDSWVTINETDSFQSMVIFKGTVTWKINITLNQGHNVIQIRATDTSENTASNRINIYFEKAEPKITTSASLDLCWFTGGLFSILCIILIILFNLIKKRRKR